MRKAGTIGVGGVVFLTVLFTLSSVYSLEVQEKELKSVDKIKFENYTGPHSQWDTALSIRSIGRQLARGARRTKSGDRFRYHMKYSVIRVMSDQEPEKYGADIFSIDKDAAVDHVKNIRRILSAYLETMYGYKRDDAETIATFITYYNAVYRGKVDYFQTKYKEEVMKHITAENAGLATKYSDWPGKTRILIPINVERKRGDLDQINPDVISDSNVVKEMKKDEENVENRKNLVDIKEKVLERDITELDKEKEELEREKERIAKKEKEIADREAKLKEDEKNKTKSEEDLAKEKQRIEDEKNKLAEDKRDVEESKENIESEEKKLKEKETNLAEEKRDVERDEIKRDINQDPEKAKEELRKKEEELAKREDELRQEQLHKNIYQDKFYYMRIKEYKSGGHYVNDMYMIEPGKKEILFKSPVRNIAGSRYDIFSDGVVVITRRDKPKTGYVLTLLDRETLQAKTYGEEDIFERSFVVIRDEYIYAVVTENNRYYLGKFDKQLKMVARSDETVSENTFITFYKDYVYINSADNKILVLNNSTLARNDEVKIESNIPEYSEFEKKLKP